MEEIDNILLKKYIMKLLTEELKARFAAIGSQANERDPLVIAKFFDPVGSATWLATEYESEHNICLGYVKDLVPGAWNDEWGTFSIDELEAIKRPLGLGIERDVYFQEQRFSKAIGLDYCKEYYPHLLEQEVQNRIQQRLSAIQSMEQEPSNDREL